MARFLSRVIQRNASRLVYSEYGVPSEVIRLEEFPDPEVSGPNDVVVKMLAAAIHPADINTIQGTYAIKPPLPAVGGGDGVGRVVAVGDKVTKFKPGDMAFPIGNMSGTWSTHCKNEESKFVKVSSKLDVRSATFLRTNPGTAFLMLNNFVDLQEGDLIIQNGANSAVGQAVIEIAKSMKVVTVNIVRDRPNIEELKKELCNLGADHVFTEQELRQSTEFREGRLPKARLALNCVGGQSSTELIQVLGKRGVHVTYGGMSLKPVIGPTSALIFKDISIRGFWLSRWMDENAATDKLSKMYDHLTVLALSGQLSPPKHQAVKLSDYATALAESMKGFKYGKVIFDMEL